jgi:hypothetical protein
LGRVSRGGFGTDKSRADGIEDKHLTAVTRNDGFCCEKRRALVVDMKQPHSSCAAVDNGIAGSQV